MPVQIEEVEEASFTFDDTAFPPAGATSPASHSGRLVVMETGICRFR